MHPGYACGCESCRGEDSKSQAVLLGELRPEQAELTREQADRVLRLCGWGPPPMPFVLSRELIQVAHRGWLLRIDRSSGGVALSTLGGVDRASCTLTVEADYLMVAQAEAWAESLRGAPQRDHT